MEIFTAVIVLGIMGAVFGIILAVASKVFYVPVDEKVEKIQSVLPGANCGACGFPGCSGLAAAIARGEAPTNGCAVGGADVAAMVADIMGGDALDSERQIATVLCQGNCNLSKSKYKYEGVKDGMNEIVFFGGHKACPSACIGCENCVRACKFDAIHVIDDVAVVDRDKCVGCSACVKACPKNVIELVSEKKKYHVRCKNTEKAKEVRGKCSIGCIACSACARVCPKQAITVENNLAKIDYDLCVSCGMCSQKCPTHAIPMQERDIKAVKMREEKAKAEKEKARLEAEKEKALQEA